MQSNSSPLSAFLSNLLEERFGSTQAKSRIVVDNPLSHGPYLTGPISSTTINTDYGSLARTISTSSSSLSSSRWDPNAFTPANKNTKHCGIGHQNSKALRSPEPSPFESSPDIPTAPVRRDSPGDWPRKKKTSNKSSKRFIATGITISPVTGKPTFKGEDIYSSILPPPYPVRQVSCDMFISTSEPNLSRALKVKPAFGTTDSLSESDLLPPPFPVRQVSLTTSELFPSRSEPNLASLLHSIQKDLTDPKGKKSVDRSKKKKKSRKFKGEGKKKKHKKIAPSQSPPSPSTPSAPSSPSTPTKLYRYLRSSLSPQKRTKKLRSPKESGSQAARRSSRTPSPTKRSTSVPPKNRKRENPLRQIVGYVGIPDTFQFPILHDDNTENSDNVTVESGAVNRCHRHPVLTSRSEHPAPESSSDGDESSMSSPRSTLPEGRSLVSALTSLPFPVESQSATALGKATKKTRANITSKAARSALESHRSLSETLLSCDRSEPSSPAVLKSKSTRRRKKTNRKQKRAPPIQPIRQLSRPLLEL